MEKDAKYYWHARGITGGNIIKGMHKHETADIFEKLPSDILLLRATLPQEQEDYRAMTSKIFEQKTGGQMKKVLNTTHMLHWDNPDVVVDVIRKSWSNS